MRRILHDLLEGAGGGCDDLQSELERLECRYDGAVYSELIHLLCHLSIDPQEAKQLWSQITEHRGSMERRMGTTVDPRVALLDYFVTVSRRLKNPTVIEMRIFEETRESVYRDELTGLYNYRYFSEHLAQEMARHRRSNAPLSLALIDVDNFKSYNDRHGHAEGNDALEVIARLLDQAVRIEDVATRYGGEEFALILPATPKLGARNLAERVRKKISSHRFLHGEAQPGEMLSVSIGIATMPADAADTDELVRKADQAMYQAKADGKNRVRLFGHSGRSYRRIDTRLSGEFRLFEDEFHPLTTVSISDAGLSFVSDRSLADGSPVEILLNFQDSCPEAPIIGRVVYTKPTTVGQFEVAVSLEESTTANRQLLARFVRDGENVDGVAQIT